MMLDKFYLIVGDAETVERLVPLGVRLVQLRIKEAPQDEIRTQILWAKAVCDQYRTKLIINDHWQAALDTGCDFVHLGQKDTEHADFPALRKAGVRIGISTHDKPELERALSLSADYVALGPVYPTLLKKMPWAPQGLEKLREWKAMIGALPLVAIGGLTPERLPGVFGAGADSAAVVTDIQQAPEPAQRTREWITATR